MTAPFGPVTQLIQGVTLAVVLTLTTLALMATEPHGRAGQAQGQPSLSALAASQPGTPLEVRVQLRTPADRAHALAAVRLAGGVPLGRLTDGLRARMSATAAVALARRPEVRGVVVDSR
jgi:hypothetical protein